MRRRLQKLSLSLLVGLAACAQPFAPGDRVAARWTEAFYEGTVLSVDGKLVMVQWDQAPPEKSGLPIDWVVKLGGAAPIPKAGAWVLCPAGRHWELCLVKSVGAEKIEVSAANADGVPYRPEALMAVPAGLADWAAKAGPAQIRHARMLELLPLASPASAGQPVTVGQFVLARWQDGNWWEGSVKRIEGDQPVVEWLDGSAPSVRERADVAPVTRLGMGVEEGELVVCRWKKDTRWWRATVEKVRGMNLEGTWEDGSKGKVFAGDCVRAK